MKMKKRMISLFLAFVLVVSFVPSTALAMEETGSITDNLALAEESAGIGEDQNAGEEAGGETTGDTAGDAVGGDITDGIAGGDASGDVIDDGNTGADISGDTTDGSTDGDMSSDTTDGSTGGDVSGDATDGNTGGDISGDTTDGTAGDIPENITEENTEESAENVEPVTEEEAATVYTITVTLPEEGVSEVLAEDELSHLTQTVTKGETMEDISLVSTYEDEPFESDMADILNEKLFADTGISATCSEAGVITIGGTPITDVTVNLADAFADDPTPVLSDLIYVDGNYEDYDSGNSGTDRNHPMGTIANALTKVSDGGTICISSTELYEPAGGVTINKNVTITAYQAEYGQTSTIKRQSSAVTGPTFTVSSGVTLTLKSVTLEGGNYSVADARAITVQSGGTLNLETNVTIQNYNLTSGNGGAIYVNGGTVNMKAGAITGNHAVAGAGVYLASGTFNMVGGKISGNTASCGGAGIYVNDGSTFTAGGTATVKGNTGASSENANVYLPTGKVAISADVPLASGASIGVNGNPTEDSDVQFATGAKSGDEAFFFCDGSDAAVTVYCDGTKDTMNGATHTHEANTLWFSVTATEDSHVHSDGSGWTLISELSDIRAGGNYCLRGNVALSETWESSYSDVTLCLNGKNITGASGSDTIKVTSGSLTIVDCKDKGTITHSSSATGRGVSIAEGATFTLGEGASISGNAGPSGAGVLNRGSFVLDGGTINGNTASTRDAELLGGGGVYNTGANAAITINSGVITENATSGDGGGIYLWSGTMTMTGGTISYNKGTHCGGGVYICQGTFNMSGGEISYNTATDNTSFGGGIGMTSTSSYTPGEINLSGNAAIIHNECAPVTGGGGGGIYCGRGSITMKDSVTISGNKALNGTGGGLFAASSSTFVMESGKISDNYAKSGGGVYLNSSVTTDTCFTMNGGEITGNTAWNGNGGGIGTIGGKEVVLNGGEISNNTAVYGGTEGGYSYSVGWGGGVHISSTNLTINDGVTITNNTAETAGGVSYYGGKTQSFNMTGGSITNNKATGTTTGKSQYDAGAGGIYTSATVNISGGEISGNTANMNGGGISVFKSNYYGATVTVSGTTRIADNTVNGASVNVYLYSDAVLNAGALDNTASVGVTAADPTTGPTVVNSSTDTTIFTSDNDSYKLVANGSGGLKLQEITTKITEGGVDATYTYSGSPVECGELKTRDHGSEVSGVTYTYEWQKKGEDGTYTTIENLTDKTGPSDAGTYKLNVKAIQNGTTIATKSWNFTINKATGTGSVSMDGWTYGDTAKSPVPTSDTNGTANVTYRYKEKNAEDTSYGSDKPTKAGTYTVQATFAETDNYMVVVATTDFTIAQKSVTASITAENKVYDGKVDATVEATLDGTLDSDTVTPKVTDAAFANKNVDTNKTVTATISLEGADAANYTLSSSSATTTAAITAKEVTITGTTVANTKTYDRTTTATITNNGTLNGVVENDTVTIKAGTASYGDKNVDTEKPVTFTDFSLEGADAGNYTLKEQPASVQAAITAAEVTIADVTVENTKVYDGNTTAKITNNGTLTGVISGDTVTIKAGTASYGDKNVNPTKTVTFTGFTLEGADAENYTLKEQPANTTAAITAKELTVNVSASDKTYNKNDTAEVNVSLSGAVENDQVSLNTENMSAKFDSADAGENKTVTVSGLTLQGEDAANYALPSTITGTAKINKATPTAEDCTVTITGWTYGDAPSTPQTNSQTNPGTPTVEYKGKDAEEDYTTTVPTKAGTYTVRATFPESTNYNASTAVADFTISPKTLTMTATAKDKVYDGTTKATVETALNTTGVVGEDKVTLVTDGVTATFDTKDFGENKSVTLTGTYTLGGEDAGNYSLTQPTGLKANITKKELTVTLTIKDKTYDGKQGAAFDGEPTLNGVVASEDVTLINGVPSFSTARVGENIDITFDPAFSLSGTAISNYTLKQPTGITANINAYTATGDEYSTTTEEWTNQDFKITAKEGWEVSITDTADGGEDGWKDSLTYTDETGDGSKSVTFYVKNKESGIISQSITKTYKIDKTAPTGEISMDEDHSWTEFLEDVTFDLFYKEKQTVTLAGQDDGSGVEKVEYLLTDEVLTKEELEEKEFTTYEDALSLEPDQKVIVYTKITDKAGNVTYLRSNGIVIDGTAPVIEGAEEGKTYCAAVTLTITDEYLEKVTRNGEEVTLTENKLTLDPAEGEQTVVATDKAGNTTTITVTVNDGHTWLDWTSNGDGTHTRTCKYDASHTETADCHGGEATCTEKAICEDCKEAYGELDPDHHSDLKHVEAKAATTTEEGNIEYWYCAGCGKYFSDEACTKEIQEEDTVIAKLTDNSGSGTSSGSTSEGGSGTDTTSGSGSTKTGDTTNVVPYVIALAMAAALLAGSVTAKKRKKQN